MATWGPAELRQLDGGRVAVWGLGEEGWASLSYLRRLLPSAELTVLIDDVTPPPSVSARLDDLPGVSLVVGREGPADLGRFDLVVKSPGVSLYRPEIVAARKLGVPFTSATQLWFDRRSDARVVCITGTKGKSTTVSMLAHCLRSTGLRALEAGNIGSPPLALTDIDPQPQIWVLEISSYQAADLEAVPTLAVLLNLFPEHLTWHRGEQQYYRDKLHLLQHLGAGEAVLNWRDPTTRRFLERFDRPLFFDDPSGFHVRGSDIWEGQERRARGKDLRLVGVHNLVNACAALTVAWRLGASIDGCLAALTSFAGLPHRLERLGELDGILYVDDSISTIPQSAAAAVEAYAHRPVTLLLGGHDRGLDYRHLAEDLVARPVHAVVTLPVSGPRIAMALRQALAAAGGGARPRLFEAESLEAGVEIARRATPAGGVVLLSPAAASFGSFADYRERGRAFRSAAGFDD